MAKALFSFVLNTMSVCTCTGYWTVYLSISVQVTEQYSTSVCSDDWKIYFISLYRSSNILSVCTCTGNWTVYFLRGDWTLNNISLCSEDWTIYLSVQMTEQYICLYRWLNNISVCCGDWTMFLSDHDWTIFLSNQVTEHEVQNSVRSIPKLDTLILVKVKLLL
jgi:hypothetical protein